MNPFCTLQLMVMGPHACCQLSRIWALTLAHYSICWKVLPPLSYWVNTYLFFKMWLKRHLIQEVFPALPENLQILSISCYNHLSQMAGSLRAVSMLSSSVCLALSTASKFQYCTQGTKHWRTMHHKAHLALLLPQWRYPYIWSTRGALSTSQKELSLCHK